MSLTTQVNRYKIKELISMTIVIFLETYNLNDSLVFHRQIRNKLLIYMKFQQLSFMFPLQIINFLGHSYRKSNYLCMFKELCAALCNKQRNLTKISK